MLKDKVGISTQIPFQNYRYLEETIFEIKSIGINNIRLITPWQDLLKIDGLEWINYLINSFSINFNSVILCVCYTPKYLSINGEYNGRPKHIISFINCLNDLCKWANPNVEYIELWDEPNNDLYYDSSLDNGYSFLYSMLNEGASVLKNNNKKVILGALNKKTSWKFLHNYIRKYKLNNIDVIGISGFPEHELHGGLWRGFQEHKDTIEDVLKFYNINNKKVWITKAGCSNLYNSDEVQFQYFNDLINTDVDRVYWQYIKNSNMEYLPKDNCDFIGEQKLLLKSNINSL